MANETFLPLVDAVEQATGRRPHLCTALRWCTKPNRFGIQLESRVLGGRRLTTVASVLTYMEATTAASKGGMFAPAQTPRQQDVAAQRDAKKLAARLAKS
jgi:hypothetical protein